MSFIIAESIHNFYERYDEANRLSTGAFQLEFVRTQEVLLRHLPAPPAKILDIGGGPGIYSCWLAKLGYEVHLLDPVPSHLDHAKALSARQPEHPIAGFILGDAGQLSFPNESADAVLMCGPLYHLQERQERLVALKEAYRVLHKGGWLFAAVISRFASALGGLYEGVLDDPEFSKIVAQDLTDGKHRNPTGNLYYFTDAYFHRVEELVAELIEAGFHHEKTLALEGPGGWLQNFDAWWNDAARRERLLNLLRKLESEPSLIGISAHIMGIARKQ